MERLLLDVCDTFEEAMLAADSTSEKTEILYCAECGTYRVFKAGETKREKALREMLEKVHDLQLEAMRWQREGDQEMVELIFGKITDLYKEFYKEWM